MAKDEFTVKITGREDLFSGLDELEDSLDDIVKESFIAQQHVFEEGIRVSWVSQAGGKVGDFIYDSISINTVKGSDGKSHVGMVGVFNVDSIASAHDRLEPNPRTGRKPMNAAQIAYWTEFGTSRLRSGQRKSKKEEYDEEDLITVAPKPFVSTAFYSTLNEQEKAFVETFNARIEGIK